MWLRDVLSSDRQPYMYLFDRMNLYPSDWTLFFIALLLKLMPWWHEDNCISFIAQYTSQYPSQAVIFTVVPFILRHVKSSYILYAGVFSILVSKFICMWLSSSGLISEEDFEGQMLSIELCRSPNKQ